MSIRQSPCRTRFGDPVPIRCERVVTPGDVPREVGADLLGQRERQILDKLAREPFTVPRSTMRQWCPYAGAPAPSQAHTAPALHRREPG